MMMLLLLIVVEFKKTDAGRAVNISRVSNDSIFVNVGSIHLGNPAAALITEFSLAKLSSAVAEACSCVDDIAASWKDLNLQTTPDVETVAADIVASRSRAGKRCSRWRRKIEDFYAILLNRSPYINRKKRLAVSTVFVAAAIGTAATSAILSLFSNGLPPGLVQTVRQNEYKIGSLKADVTELRNLSIITGRRIDALRARSGVLWALQECDSVIIPSRPKLIGSLTR